MLSRRKALIAAFKFFDLFVMILSFGISTWATFHLERGGISFEDFLSMRIKIQNFAIFFVFVFTWQLIFSSFRLYESNRLSNRFQESVDVLGATSVGLLVFASAAILFRLRMITPTFLFIFWTASSSICILSRIILRQFLELVRLRGRNLRYMLIVGTNERAVRFTEYIESQPELGYRLLGFVENGWNGNRSFEQKGYRVVSDFKGFRSFIRENAVDEVVLCLPIKSYYDQISKISRHCEEQGIIVRHLSDSFRLKSAHCQTADLEGEPIISIYTGAMRGWQVHVKRFMDLVLSAVLLVVLSPLFLVVAILVKITSPGPSFFVQERIGLNKRRFPLYKFRTMEAGAEKRIKNLEKLNEATGPVFKIRNDPRITRIGRVLRKTSIDELPQLLNVLKGDMSLVGPRALPVRDYEGFSQDWHRRRFSVQPGITCLWQVTGRSNISFEKWMELDLQYIDNWSLWLDLSILFRTFPAVLRGSGAC
jgi:exopolysaccharide biosynthesis polyprenyl glycosylphosphotransferase